MEEELNPMSYAKVFDKDKYLTFKPVIEGKQPIKHNYVEFFENKRYYSNLRKNEER